MKSSKQLTEALIKNAKQINEKAKDILPAKEKSEKVLYGLSSIRQIFNFIKSNLDFFDKLKLLEALNNINHFFHILGVIFPPIRLVVVGLSNLWEIIHASFHEQSKSLSRGARIALSAGIIISAIIAVAIPALLLTMVIIGAAITLVKDGVKCVQLIYDYVQHRNKAAAKREELTLAKNSHTSNAEDIKKLIQELAELETQTAALQQKMGLAAINIFWTAMALTGCILLLTPLAPVGVILILVSAAGGMATHFAPKIIEEFKKIFSPKPALANASVTEQAKDLNPTLNEKNDLTITKKNDLTQKKNLKEFSEYDSTSKISTELVEGELGDVDQTDLTKLKLGNTKEHIATLHDLGDKNFLPEQNKSGEEAKNLSTNKKDSSEKYLLVQIKELENEIVAIDKNINEHLSNEKTK